MTNESDMNDLTVKSLLGAIKETDQQFKHFHKTVPHSDCATKTQRK